MLNLPYLLVRGDPEILKCWSRVRILENLPGMENSAGARRSQGKREELALSSRISCPPTPGPLSSCLGGKEQEWKSNLSLPFQGRDVRTRRNVQVGKKTCPWLPASFFLFPQFLHEGGECPLVEPNSMRRGRERGPQLCFPNTGSSEMTRSLGNALPLW